jgi:hypothetical protein
MEGLRKTTKTLKQDKNPIFWDITPCSPLKVDRRFGVSYRIHLQVRRISQARNQHEARSKQSSASSILKVEAIYSSETSEDYTAIPGDKAVHNHSCENLIINQR